MFAGLVTNGGEYLLTKLRAALGAEGIDTRRLPGWVSAAQMRAGWVNGSAVIVFQDASAGADDELHTRGPVGADAVVLLNLPDFSATGASLAARDTPAMIVLAGAGAPEGATGLPTTLNLSGYHALFDSETPPRSESVISPGAVWQDLLVDGLNPGRGDLGSVKGRRPGARSFFNLDGQVRG